MEIGSQNPLTPKSTYAIFNSRPQTRGAKERGSTKMARQSDTPTEQVTITEDGAPVEQPATAQKSTITIAANVPIAMKELLDKVASDAGKTTTVYVRELLAQSVNFTLPPAQRKGRATNKYEGLTDEQKAEAQKSEQTKKRQLAAALLAALEDNALVGISVDEILAKYKPATRAPKAKEDTTTDSVPSDPAVVPASAE